MDHKCFLQEETLLVVRSFPPSSYVCGEEKFFRFPQWNFGSAYAWNFAHHFHACVFSENNQLHLIQIFCATFHFLLIVLYSLKQFVLWNYQLLLVFVLVLKTFLKNKLHKLRIQLLTVMLQKIQNFFNVILCWWVSCSKLFQMTMVPSYS